MLSLGAVAPPSTSSPCLEEPRGARARRRPGPREALGLSEAAAASGGRGRCGAAGQGAAGGGGAAGSRGPGPCAPVLRGAARGGSRQCVSLCRASARPPLPGGPQTSTHQRPESHAACRDRRRRRKGVRAKPGGWHQARGPAGALHRLRLRRPPPSGLPSPGASPPPFLLVLLAAHSAASITVAQTPPSVRPTPPSPPAQAPRRLRVRPIGPVLTAPIRPPTSPRSHGPPPLPPRHPSRLLPQPLLQQAPFLLHQARFPRLRSP